MPNWVDNTLHINKKDMDKVVKDGVVDFNILIPMPKSLDMPSGGPEEDEIVYFLTDRCTKPLKYLSDEDKEIIKNTVNNQFSKDDWPQKVFIRVMEDTYNASKFKKDEMYTNGKKYVENYKTYGATSWYDWCTEHWGVKWNASGKEQVSEGENEDEIVCVFDTPWNIPIKWLDALEAAGVQYTLDWYEEQGYYGTIKFDGKERTETEDFDRRDDYDEPAQ